jgi:hypothetical protein
VYGCVCWSWLSRKRTSLYPPKNRSKLRNSIDEGGPTDVYGTCLWTIVLVYWPSFLSIDCRSYLSTIVLVGRDGEVVFITRGSDPGTTLPIRADPLLQTTTDVLDWEAYPQMLSTNMFLLMVASAELKKHAPVYWIRWIRNVGNCRSKFIPNPLFPKFLVFVCFSLLELIRLMDLVGIFFWSSFYGLVILKFS